MIFLGGEWFSTCPRREKDLDFWNVTPYHNRPKADEKLCEKICLKEFYALYIKNIHILNNYETTPSHIPLLMLIAQSAYFGLYRS